eukprot:Phypoly_transcript_04227.p1 GENE.Phypoly_transcript_04227~~Phypoly_transcript_04227.p1  ORF type:complete len:207 (+),score=20.84 Phypoly_transcript_04227:1443-2063(+)
MQYEADDAAIEQGLANMGIQSPQQRVLVAPILSKPANPVLPFILPRSIPNIPSLPPLTFASSVAAPVLPTNAPILPAYNPFPILPPVDPTTANRPLGNRQQKRQQNPEKYCVQQLSYGLCTNFKAEGDYCLKHASLLATQEQRESLKVLHGKIKRQKTINTYTERIQNKQTQMIQLGTDVHNLKQVLKQQEEQNRPELARVLALFQ